jgi:hypothetical protein
MPRTIFALAVLVALTGCASQAEPARPAQEPELRERLAEEAEPDVDQYVQNTYEVVAIGECACEGLVRYRGADDGIGAGFADLVQRVVGRRWSTGLHHPGDR